MVTREEYTHEIHLTPSEIVEACDWAMTLLDHRRSSSRNVGAIPEEERALAGAFGEQIYHRLSELPTNWVLTDKGDSGADFADGVEVRGTPTLYHRPNLLLRIEPDGTINWAERYALVHLAIDQDEDQLVHSVRGYIVGWQTGEEVRANCAYKDKTTKPSMPRPCYLYPQSKLLRWDRQLSQRWMMERTHDVPAPGQAGS